MQSNVKELKFAFDKTKTIIVSVLRKKTESVIFFSAS